MSALDDLRAECITLRQAIGLASTIKPSMVIDVDDPIGMMRQVCDEVDILRSKLAAASDLAEACEELTTALAIAMQIVAEEAETEQLLELCACAGIKDGIGVRARAALAKARGSK